MRQLSHRPLFLLVVPLTVATLLASLAILQAIGAADVSDIATLERCINDNLTGKAADIGESVDPCIPRGCKLVMTMSPFSAQAACKLNDCQLPRVILDCPDPTNAQSDLRLRPSFLLCPLNSKSEEGVFGTDRMEVGKDTKRAGGKPTEMAMGDIPIPKTGNFPGVSNSRSTKAHNKGCNVCHTKTRDLLDTDPGTQVVDSQPIDPFEQNFEQKDLAPFVIFTNEPKDKDKVKPDAGFKKESIKEVCDCIEKDPQKIKDLANDLAAAKAMVAAQGLDLTDEQVRQRYLNPNFNVDTLIKLCRKLQAYVETRGCGTQVPNGPPAPGCRGLRGGGKFLGWQTSTTAVSTVRLDVSGNSSASTPTTFAFSDVEGDLTVYNAATRTQVTSVVFSSLSGDFGPGYLHAVATGIGMLTSPVQRTGLPTPVVFDIIRSGTVVSYTLRNSTSSALLAGGTGEAQYPDRTALELTQTVP